MFPFNPLSVRLFGGLPAVHVIRCMIEGHRVSEPCHFRQAPDLTCVRAAPFIEHAETCSAVGGVEVNPSDVTNDTAKTA